MKTQFIISKGVAEVFKFFIELFSTCLISLSWYMISESSVYKSRVDVSTCSISLTQIRNKRGPKMGPCDTPQEISVNKPSLNSFKTLSVKKDKHALHKK